MKKTIFGCLIFLLIFAVMSSAKKKDKLVDEGIRPALLVIDIQNKFLPMMSETGMPLKFINWTIDIFRKYGFPVIRVYHTDPQFGPKSDSEEFQFPKSIKIKDDDPKIVKNYPSAFKKTNLDELLRAKKCNTLFLCGLSSVGCVLATYFGGEDLDYNVFLVKDALMSHKSSYTQAIQEIFDAVGYKVIHLTLRNAVK